MPIEKTSFLVWHEFWKVFPELNFGKVMRVSLNGLSMSRPFTCKSLEFVTTAGFSKGFFERELS